MNFVIFGNGNIARTYLRAIDQIQDSAVVGIISRKKSQDSFDWDTEVYSSLSDVNASYDAIIICTPNGLHHLPCIEAAGLGKHVLCEKPLDITLPAMDRMIATCEQNEVKLGVAYQRRLSSDNPSIKKLIEDDALGRIFSVDLSIKNYRDDQYYNSAPYRGTKAIDGGGPFMQQASHYIDLYLWFFGEPDQIVSKMATFTHDLNVEDHGAAICYHNKGLLGTITASTSTKPGFPAELSVYSTKGYFKMVNDVITAWEIEQVENPTIISSEQNQHTGSATAVVADTTNHEAIIRNFIDAVNLDKQPLISGREARKATKMILEIYENAI